MATWKSPLFSDIRNKMGENVVFSMWKGRPYMRSYVVPANPQTNKQQAHRDVMAKLVAWWQSAVDTEAKATQWDEEALPYQISGFNLLTKLGRKSEMSAVAGTGAGEVDITYTITMEAGNMAIYVYDVTADTWTVEDAVGSLSTGADQTKTISGLSTGNTVEIWLAYDPVLVDGDSDPQDYQAFCKWSPNESSGVADEASVTVPS